jgi:hypothetical protein
LRWQDELRAVSSSPGIRFGPSCELTLKLLQQKNETMSHN